MIDVLILAFALSMDAFAVSVGLGVKSQGRYWRLAISAGLYFGIFQGAMPLIGYMVGMGVLGWLDSVAPMIASALLLIIGVKMLYESFSEGVEEGISIITSRVMLTLAVATSVDAMAAGFTLALMSVPVLLSCFLIALVTFIVSVLGVFVGKLSGAWLESKAEALGGVILILIAVRVLWIS